jgi:hypothetical protein
MNPKLQTPKAPVVQEPKATSTIRTFHCDQRNNPSAHNFAVCGAYEDLKIVREALTALEDRSRIPASIMASALHEAMQKEIEEDAAYFEAAALLFAGLEPPKEEE